MIFDLVHSGLHNGPSLAAGRVLYLCLSLREDASRHGIGIVGKRSKLPLELGKYASRQSVRRRLSYDIFLFLLAATLHMRAVSCKFLGVS